MTPSMTWKRVLRKLGELFFDVCSFFGIFCPDSVLPGVTPAKVVSAPRCAKRVAPPISAMS